MDRQETKDMVTNLRNWFCQLETIESEIDMALANMARDTDEEEGMFDDIREASDTLHYIMWEKLNKVADTLETKLKTRIIDVVKCCHYNFEISDDDYQKIKNGTMTIEDWLCENSKRLDYLEDTAEVSFIEVKNE